MNTVRVGASRRAGDGSEVAYSGTGTDAVSTSKSGSGGSNLNLIREGAIGLAISGAAGVTGLAMMSVPGGQIAGAGLLIGAIGSGSVNIVRLVAGFADGSEQDEQLLVEVNDITSKVGLAGAVAGVFYSAATGSAPEKAVKTGASAGAFVGAISGLKKMPFTGQKQALHGLNTFGLGKRNRKEFLEIQIAASALNDARTVRTKVSNGVSETGRPVGDGRARETGRAGDGSEANHGQRRGGGGGGRMLQH